MDALALEWLVADDPRMCAVHELRHAALFAPFGLPRDDGWDAAGAERLHLVALRGADVVGYASVILEPDGTGHIRQVSVAEAVRGAGVGRALMEEAEHEAHRRGLRQLWLNARVTAEGFYHRLGYTTVSEVFPSGRTGVPHVRMERPLVGRETGSG